MKRALLLLLLLGCPRPTPGPTPPSPTCADVCKNYERLGCEAARPTARGATCAQVCENVQTSGIIRWNLGCRSAATTCAAADTCEMLLDAGRP